MSLGRKFRAGAAALVASVGVLLALPLFSFGLSLHGAIGGATHVVTQITGAVQGAVQHVAGHSSSGSTGSGGGGGGGSSSGYVPRASSSPPDTPAMYGSNPHGQGTVASVALTPSPNRPYTYSPGGSGGEITVLGRGRSEQTGSGYHAHTTILGLLGQELLGVDAQPGHSNKGPLDAIQTGLLDPLCKGTGGLICLTVLEANTVASSNGANTMFSLLHANIGGQHGVDAGVAESSSRISSTSSCQNSSGSSSAANVNIAGGPLASLAKSSESSSACSGRSPSQTASSSVIGLGGQGVPVPQPGCANGTPNTKLSVLGLLSTICNADDTAQAAAPAGVREALTAIVLPATGSSLAKSSVAQSESHAVAPASTSACTGNGCPGGNGGGNGGHGGGVSGQNTGTGEGELGGSESQPEAGPAVIASGPTSGDNATEAASNGSLPFTGENVLEVVFLGLVLAAVGLGLATRTRPE